MATVLTSQTLQPGNRITIQVPINADCYAEPSDLSAIGTGLLYQIGEDGVPVPGTQHTTDATWYLGPFDEPTTVGVACLKGTMTVQLRVHRLVAVYASMNETDSYLQNRFTEHLPLLQAGLAICESDGVPAPGYLNGAASKGSLCIDYTNANLYINTGTLNSTVWTLMTRSA